MVDMTNGSTLPICPNALVNFINLLDLLRKQSRDEKCSSCLSAPWSAVIRFHRQAEPVLGKSSAIDALCSAFDKRRAPQSPHHP